MKKVVVISLTTIIMLGGLVFMFFDPSDLALSKQRKNSQLIEQEMAYHIGVMAYLYGYPIVDMHKQMHNETHATGDKQQVVAAVNRFYRFPDLITPETAGNLRAPNSDTLYYSAWVDLSSEPVIVHTPNTNGRYYSIAVTDQFAEVEHIGRSTTGTEQGYFALTGPGWSGNLPPNVKQIAVKTPKAWLLGRMLVDSQADFPQAKALVDDIWLAELSEFIPGVRPAPRKAKQGETVDPIGSLAFFEILNQQLQTIPTQGSEIAIIDQLNQIGIGLSQNVDEKTMSNATREGLSRAIEDATKIIQASTFRELPDQNGWMVSTQMGRYGFNYMHRASVVKGGYSNRPEESLYAAALFDSDKRMLNGDEQYQIKFEAGNLPPVDGFWSIATYTLDAKLEANAISRYSIGDRTPGLQFAKDGSLTITLQNNKPKQDNANWLPTPEGRYVAIIRLYEPKTKALGLNYEYPLLKRVEQ